MKHYKQKRFDEFSKKYIYWIIAFNDNEFDKKLKEYNLTLDDIISIGSGGFIKKEHKELYLKEIKKLKN